MKLTSPHPLVQQQLQPQLHQQPHQPIQQQPMQQQPMAQVQGNQDSLPPLQQLLQLQQQQQQMNGFQTVGTIHSVARGDVAAITPVATVAAAAMGPPHAPSSRQLLMAQQQHQQQLLTQRGLLQMHQLPVGMLKPQHLLQQQQQVQQQLQQQQLQQQFQQQLMLLRSPDFPGLYSAFCRLLHQVSLDRLSLRDARVRVLLVVLRWLQQHEQQQHGDPSRLFREGQFERLVQQTRAYMQLLLQQQPLKEEELLQLGLSPAVGFKPDRDFLAAVAAASGGGFAYKPPASKQQQQQQRPRSHQLFVQLYDQQLQEQQQKATAILEQQALKFEELARLRLEQEEEEQQKQEQKQQQNVQRQLQQTAMVVDVPSSAGGGRQQQQQSLSRPATNANEQQQSICERASGNTIQEAKDETGATPSCADSCSKDSLGATAAAESATVSEEESEGSSSAEEWWGIGGLQRPVDDGTSSCMQERARISRLQRRLLSLASFQRQVREEVVVQRLTETPQQLPPLQQLPVRLARKHRALRLLRERGDRLTAARQQQQQQRQQVLQQLLDSHRRAFLQQQRDVLRQLRRVAAAVKRKKSLAAEGADGGASCGHPLHPTDCGCPGAAAVAAQMRKERLDALRKHDEAGYLKLLQETKNERLLELVRQTEGYMQQIGSLVVEQREREGIIVPAFVRLTSKGGGTTELKSLRVALAFGLALQTEEEADGAAEEASGSLSSSFLFSKERYYRITHSQREKVTELPSCLKGGTLRSYQMEGLNWLVSLHNNGLNGILADCMGLGKTVQTVSFLAYLYEKKGVRNPHLILAPLSTLHGNWRLEFKKWWPSLRIVVYEGAKDVRKALRSRIVSGVRVEGSGQETQRFLEPLFDVLLTTDAFVLRDKSFLKKIQWEYLIVDEAHRLKNPSSKLVQTLNSGFSIRRRIALTGTPLQNDIVEVWALLNFLMPSIFNAKLNFEQWLNVPLGTTAAGGTGGAGDDQPHAITVTEEEKLLIIDRLHKVLRPFLLRREKAEVADELPSKQEEIVWCPLSGVQRILYRLIEESPMGHNRMVQLRKVCNHPFLFCFSSFTPDESLVRCCGKFAMLDVLLPALKAAQHRVLVFSQMTKLLDLLEAYLSLRGYRYLRLDGGTSSEERQTRLALYNQENSPYFLFILSTKAGGLGVNLQSADTVIIFDSDWNPQNDEQAQSRAHRIGQKREVLTIRFVTPSSVEEQILHSAELKLDKDALVIKSGMYNGELQDRETERQEQVREILRRRKQLEANLTRPFDFAILKNQLSRNPAESRVFDALQKIRQLLHLPGLIYGEAVPPCLFRWSKTLERSQMDLVQNTAQAAQDWKLGYSLSDFWSIQKKKKIPSISSMQLQLVGGSNASQAASAAGTATESKQQAGTANFSLEHQHQQLLQPKQLPQQQMLQDQAQEGAQHQQQMQQMQQQQQQMSGLHLGQRQLQVHQMLQPEQQVAQQQHLPQQANQQQPLQPSELSSAAVLPGTASSVGGPLHPHGGSSESVKTSVAAVPAESAASATVVPERLPSPEPSSSAAPAAQDPSTCENDASVTDLAAGTALQSPPSVATAAPVVVSAAAEPAATNVTGALDSASAAVPTTASEAEATFLDTRSGVALSACTSVPPDASMKSTTATVANADAAPPQLVASLDSAAEAVDREKANTAAPDSAPVPAADPALTGDSEFAGAYDRSSSCGTGSAVGSGAASVVAASSLTAATGAAAEAGASSGAGSGPGGGKAEPGGGEGTDTWGCGDGKVGDSAGAADVCLSNPQRWKALLNGAISQALTDAINDQRFSAFVELPSPTVYKDYYERVSKPVCLLQIRKFSDKQEFTSLNKLEKYLTRLAENARAYNGQESPLFLRSLECIGAVMMKSRVNACIAFHSLHGHAQGEKMRRLFELYRSCWDSTCNTPLPDGQAAEQGDAFGGELMEAEAEAEEDDASGVSSQLSSTVRSAASYNRSGISSILPSRKGGGAHSYYDDYSASPSTVPAAATSGGGWQQQKSLLAGPEVSESPAKRKTLMRLPARPPSAGVSPGRAAGGSKKQPYLPSYLGYVPQGIELPLPNSSKSSLTPSPSEQQQQLYPSKKKRKAAAQDTELAAAFVPGTAAAPLPHTSGAPPPAPHQGLPMQLQQHPVLLPPRGGFQAPETSLSGLSPPQQEHQPFAGAAAGLTAAVSAPVGPPVQQAFGAAVPGYAFNSEGSHERKAKKERKAKAAKAKKRGRDSSLQEQLPPQETLPLAAAHHPVGETSAQRPPGVKPLRIRLSFGSQQQSAAAAPSQQLPPPPFNQPQLPAQPSTVPYDLQQQLLQQPLHGQAAYAPVQHPAPDRQQHPQQPAPAAPPKFRIRLPTQPPQ